MQSNIGRQSLGESSEKMLNNLSNSLPAETKEGPLLASKNGNNDGDGNATLTGEDGDGQARIKVNANENDEAKDEEYNNGQSKDIQLEAPQYRSGFKVVHGNNASSFDEFRHFNPWAMLTKEKQLEGHSRKFYSQVEKLANILKFHFDSGGPNPFGIKEENDTTADVNIRRGKRTQEVAFTKDEEELHKKLTDLEKLLSSSQWQGILDCFAVKDCLLRGEAEELAERFRICHGVEERANTTIEQKKDGLKTVGSQVVDEIFKTMRWKVSATINYVVGAYSKSKEENEDLPSDIIEGERLAAQNSFSTDEKVQENVRIWEEEQTRIASMAKKKRKQESISFLKDVERLTSEDNGSLNSPESAQAFLDLVSSPSSLSTARRRHFILGIILSTISEMERNRLRARKKERENTGSGEEEALRHLCSSSKCRFFLDMFVDMFDKGRRDCSDASSSIRPYLVTLLALAQIREYDEIPFIKVQYARQSKIISVVGDFAESKSLSSSVRSIATQLRGKWHLEQMSTAAFSPLNASFKIPDVRISGSRHSIRNEEKEKRSPRDRPAQNSSGCESTSMKRTKLETLKRKQAKFQTDSSVIQLSTTRLPEKKDEFKSKASAKEISHSDPRIHAMLTNLQRRMNTMEALCISWSTPQRVASSLINRIPTQSGELSALDESIRIRKMLQASTLTQSDNKDREMRDPDFPDTLPDNTSFVINLDDDVRSRVPLPRRDKSRDRMSANARAVGSSRPYVKRPAHVAANRESVTAKAPKVRNSIAVERKEPSKLGGVSTSALQDLKDLWKV